MARNSRTVKATEPARRAQRPRAGDPASRAVAQLFDDYGGQLYSLGMRFCGNREDAEDLVQETFLAAFRAWDRFEGRSKPSTWLYTIAARVCQRKRRRRAGAPKRLASLEELAPLADARLAVAPTDSAEAAAARREAREEVEAAIVELPELFRMPFVLKEVIGFSVAEVASILGLEPATVRTRVHRARMRVRKAVDAALPRRRVPPIAYSKTVCLDLLRAKQEALDHNSTFQFPEGVVCERCATLFATLDLASGVCRELAGDRMPAALRRDVLARLKEPA